MYDQMDQEGPQYVKGDVVWVKLSGSWWPGEVVNQADLPNDMIADFKKPPLVIVKFFGEDSYEYIKQWSNIHPYNCGRKIEFIKKGMAGFRSKLSHMTKFPKDIGIAEEKTDGNPNILSQPEFLPNKKVNLDEIFGATPAKKGKTPIAKKPKVIDPTMLTHRRFLGNDEYQAFQIIGFEGNPSIFDDDENVPNDPDKLEKPFVCDSCAFTTERPGLMKNHKRLHIDGHLIGTKRKSKKFNFEASDSEPEYAVVRPTKPRKKRLKKTANRSKDDFTHLLHEWSDNDNAKEQENGKNNNKKIEPATSSVTKSKKSNNKNTEDDIKNCFDFDEEEEEDEFLPASTGRKIPRVIPEKPKASISELMKLDDLAKADDEEEEKKPDIVENSFKELLEETAVPSIDHLTETLKPEQNFHDARTIKFPDKGGTKESCDSSKMASPKKRFVTSFAGFKAGFRKVEVDPPKPEAQKRGKKRKQLLVQDDSEEIVELKPETEEVTNQMPEEKLTKHNRKQDIKTDEANRRRSGRNKKEDSPVPTTTTEESATKVDNENEVALTVIPEEISEEIKTEDDSKLVENIEELTVSRRTRGRTRGNDPTPLPTPSKSAKKKRGGSRIPEKPLEQIEPPIQEDTEDVEEDSKKSEAAATGVVSDVTYGTSTKANKKNSRSRWDIVPPAEVEPAKTEEITEVPAAEDVEVETKAAIKEQKPPTPTKKRRQSRRAQHMEPEEIVEPEAPKMEEPVVVQEPPPQQEPQPKRSTRRSKKVSEEPLVEQKSEELPEPVVDKLEQVQKEVETEIAAVEEEVSSEKLEVAPDKQEVVPGEEEVAQVAETDVPQQETTDVPAEIVPEPKEEPVSEPPVVDAVVEESSNQTTELKEEKLEVPVESVKIEETKPEPLEEIVDNGPIKKNQWPRPNKPTNPEPAAITEQPTAPTVIKKTEPVSEPITTESEVILPLKKWKRPINNASFAESDESFLSGSLKEDIVDAIKDLEDDKKEIKTEVIPENISPKKKMQKLFENSQSVVEKVEMPLMSPLAKKKSFLFQQKVEESVESTKDEPKEEEKNIEPVALPTGPTHEPELVPISVTPTVMTEQDLADSQVEITSDQVISEKINDIDVKPQFEIKTDSPDVMESSSNSSTASSGSDQKFKTSFDNYDMKQTTVQGVIDFEDAIPPQIVVSSKLASDSVILESPKLLERLSMTNEQMKKSKLPIQTEPVKVSDPVPKGLIGKLAKPGQKIVIRPRPQSTSLPVPTSKPVILSEQIIRPAIQQGLKRQYEDVEDVETAFIIPKIPKTTEEDDSLKSKIGKAKILQQTIITPKGEVIPSSKAMQLDDNIFDINSMPIVLSDDLLTAESIQNMPVMLSEDVKPPSQVVQKMVVGSKQVILKSSIPQLNRQIPKPTTKPGAILATGTTADGKPTKYVLISTATSQMVPKPVVVKKPLQSQPPSDGAKIMVYTDAQGVQKKVMLTPQQQKALLPTGVKKTIVKGIPKSLLDSAQKPKLMDKSKPVVTLSKKPPLPTTAVRPVTTNKPQKTILIKNQIGQIVRKIQGTDDEELDRQVKEQLEAIKASSKLQQVKSSPAPEPIIKSIPINKNALRKTIVKKVEPIKDSLESKPTTVPALAPLSPKSRIPLPGQIATNRSQIVLKKSVVNKPETVLRQSKSVVKPPVVDKKPSDSATTKQVVIQDGLGNLTTVTVGQILAIPSETVDGQPQSYILVTVDESGNLTPLNNDALMSLDPSLTAGSDINSMVLQVDQQQPVMEKKRPLPPPPVSKAPDEGQQLIVTGDPVVTQKFLESLSDGTTDLASILANADSTGSVLLQTDGQQILIRTSAAPSSVPDPLFGAPKPNQDILAAALANTDVLLPSDSATIKPTTSQLSPSGGLFPMHVGNVLETSLTLSTPIMTPLEVPSTNSKKIDDQADVLGPVAKNVDLPITITDPTIAQTVAHHQLELSLPIPETTVGSSGINSPTSYSYALAGLEDSISQKSFGGSMPLLTDDVENDNNKNFNPNFGTILEGEEVVKSSTLEDFATLPLLTDDVVDDSGSSIGSTKHRSPKSVRRDLVDEGLATLGAEMCSSLSEPPPDMFDLSTLTLPRHKDDDGSSDVSSLPEPETLSLNSDNSQEIPLQPPIVATMSDLKQAGFDSESDPDSDGKKSQLLMN